MLKDMLNRLFITHEIPSFHELLNNEEQAKYVFNSIFEGRINVNTKDKSGFTVLHLAAESGNVKLTEKLLSIGAEVNIGAMNKETPLHFAAQNDHIALVMLLLDHGAKVDSQDKYGWTPLHFACQHGLQNMTELLIDKGANVNSRTKAGDTPLHGAAWWDHIEITSLLLKKGADVNASRKNGATALHAPACISIAELLIMNGARVDARDNIGCVPLHYAAFAFVPIVLGTNPILLLSKKTRIDISDPGSQLSLHIKKSIELAEVLLNNGADIDTKTKLGATPLHFAIFINHQEMVRALLSWGANVKVGLLGVTPLDLAKEMNKRELVHLLEEHG